MPIFSEIDSTLHAAALVLRGRTIESVKVLKPDMIKHHPTFSKSLKDKTIIDMKQRGAHLWIELSDGLNLMLHIRKSDRITLQKLSDTSQSRERIRCVIGHDLVIICNDRQTLGKLWIIEDSGKTKMKVIPRMRKVEG